MALTENSSIGNNIPTPDSKSLRQYYFFMIGQLQSILGSTIVQFVIIWWITLTYKRADYLAIGAFLGFAPTLIVGLFAGVYVDRWNRKKLIATVDALEALASMVLVYLFWIGEAQINYIFAIMAIRSTFQGFHGPAVQAIIPIMIPRDKLTRINSLQYLSEGLIGLIGPVVAAFLLVLVGFDNIHLLILIDMGTFLIAVMPLIFITIPSVHKKANGELIEKQPFKTEFKEGFTFIRDKKGLLALLSAFTTTNFFFMPLFILMPLIIVASLDGGAYEFGIAMAIFQGGAILSSLLMTSRNPFSKNTSGVYYSLMLGTTGILVGALGAAFGNIWIFYSGLVLAGSTTPIANISSQNIWQAVVPPEKMGRVFAVRRTIAQISAPAAMVVTGLIVTYISMINLLYISSISMYVILMFIWYFSGFQTVEADLEITDDMVVEVPTGVESMATETTSN
ncbi:MAG: MFS transporter [Candidatus Heimdallarchaeota archaeon]|nr:MFS transporter [Candidatus Heimdallarchaeota archaeon]